MPGSIAIGSSKTNRYEQKPSRSNRLGMSGESLLAASNGAPVGSPRSSPEQSHQEHRPADLAFAVDPDTAVGFEVQPEAAEPPRAERSGRPSRSPRGRCPQRDTGAPPPSAGRSGSADRALREASRADERVAAPTDAVRTSASARRRTPSPRESPLAPLRAPCAGDVGSRPRSRAASADRGGTTRRPSALRAWLRSRRARARGSRRPADEGRAPLPS